MKTNKLFTSLALGLLLVGCASNEEPSKPINQIEIPTVEQEPQEEVKPIERKVLELNTPIITTYDGENDFELQITEVRFTNDRNKYYDGVPVENVVVIKVQATNIGNESHFLSDSKFNAYDSEGNLLSSYPTTDTQYSDIEEVNVGRKATIEIAYGIPQGTQFELEVVDQITGDIVGSLYFEGVGQAKNEEVAQEENEKGIEKQNNDALYTLIKEDEETVTYLFNGTLIDFALQVQKEVELAEQGEEDLPLVQLVMGMGMSSAMDTSREYRLLTKYGDVVYIYKNGEPIQSYAE